MESGSRLPAPPKLTTIAFALMVGAIAGVVMATLLVVLSP